MAKTRAQENRAIRQEALREQLSQQKHIEKVVENIIKMEELTVLISDNEKGDISGQFELQKLKTANEQRLKLINKYLPDLKISEITGPNGGAIEVKKVEDLTDAELAAIAAGRG